MGERFNLNSHVERALHKKDISLDHNSMDNLIIALKEKPDDEKLKEQLVIRMKRIVEAEINNFLKQSYSAKSEKKWFHIFGYSSKEEFYDTLTNEMFIVVLKKYSDWDSKEVRVGQSQTGHARFANFMRQKIRWELLSLVSSLRSKGKDVSGFNFFTEDGDEAYDSNDGLHLGSFKQGDQKESVLLEYISNKKIVEQCIKQLSSHDPVQAMLVVALYGLGDQLFDWAHNEYTTVLKSGSKLGYDKLRYQKIIPKLREFAIIPGEKEGKQVARQVGMSPQAISRALTGATTYLQNTIGAQKSI